jgi:predicted dehydrogenase
MKFGIMGSGRAARHHSSALHKLKIPFVVYGRNKESLNYFNKEFKCRITSDIKNILNDPSIDFISVCTPAKFHYEHAERCLKARKNVVVEKPICTNVKDAEELIKLAKKMKLKLYTVFQNRFLDSVILVKKSLPRLGKIIFASAFVHGHRNESYYTKGKGSYDLDGGGALITQGIHYLDLLDYLMPIADISSFKTRRVFNIESEDSISTNLKFKNGALGNIQVTNCANKEYPFRIEVVGTEGRIVIEDNNIRVLDFEKGSFGDFLIKKNQKRPDLFLKLYKGVLSGKTISGEEGLRILKLVKEAYKK